jgi:hypothetical protein
MLECDALACIHFYSLQSLMRVNRLITELTEWGEEMLITEWNE